MAAKALVFQNTPVDHKLNLISGIVHQTKYGGRAGLYAEKPLHIPLIAKGKSGAAKLCGEVFGLKHLVSVDQEQIKTGFLAIAEEKILAESKKTAVLAIETIMSDGIDKAMNLYNTKKTTKKSEKEAESSANNR